MLSKLGTVLNTSQSREDPIARMATSWLGGPIGVHARIGVSRWSPIVVMFLVTTAMFVIGLVQKAPCHDEGWSRQSQVSFTHLCYSDMAHLYRERGFSQGNIAYLDRGNYPVLEYPVLTGAIMQLGATLTHWLGSGDAVRDGVLFFDVNVVVMFLLGLLTVWAVSKVVPDRPYDGLFVAAAPVLALSATINWDLVAIGLTALALLAWSRRHPMLAGCLLGLGVAANFFPLLLFGPLLVLAVRSGQVRIWLGTLLAGLATWLIVNLPIMLLATQSWLHYWSFTLSRGADYGSLWYVFALSGNRISHLNVISWVLFGLACLGIGILALRAQRRPRLAQLAFLTVVAFLIFGKVLAPQYALWLLPLLALARPRWRDWLIWQSAEVFYWAAIWLHIGQQLAPAAPNAPDRLYWLAVLARLGALVYLAVMVIRDILHPVHDPLRRDGVSDDPGGGSFDHAPDKAWVRRLNRARQARVREGAVA
ncbi:glycosyltransferase family 87 protein [Tenggerimyces flavus]|uniref:Glycosyltransferase family 87 protein n=1 Tax=Tenggerimyces flavus TaxID=1708749 RepID=A0ABV7YHK8_9ACTN|nr:hypothetical protein [Tenggerimyces flavus]MBM7784317.1 putative membrane protein [Tenggerimyces flavus]